MSPGTPGWFLLDGSLALWIRYTIDKLPEPEIRNRDVWFTLFDGEAKDRWPPPRQVSRPRPQSTPGPDRGIDDRSAELRRMFDHKTLRFPSGAQFFHLPRPRFLRTSLPKTKPISPVPFGDFSGSVNFGERQISVRLARHDLTHNWGSERAGGSGW